MTSLEIELYNFNIMDIIQQIKREKKRKKSLPDKVYDDLLRDILTGKLEQGSRLNEAKLCKTYGASRTPIREAFRRLEMDGLVDYIPNRGEFVRGFSQHEIDDMLLMRMDLEIRAVKWAIERITEEEEKELTSLFNYMEFYTKNNDIPMMIDINYAFHSLIYRYTHDGLLERTLHAYQIYTDYCCPPNYFAPNYLNKVLEEHRRIYRAIIKKDSQAATKAMFQHMKNTVKRSSPSLKVE